MKKTAKILLASGFALLLSAGAVVNFLQSARAEAEVSDLTLANIEALAAWDDKQEQIPIVQGPAKTVRPACKRCGTNHVMCQGEPNGGQCVPIHCLL